MQVLALPLGSRVDIGVRCFVADDSAQVTNLYHRQDDGLRSCALLQCCVDAAKALCVSYNHPSWSGASDSTVTGKLCSRLRSGAAILAVVFQLQAEGSD